MKITLIGMSGSGKTHWSKLLEEKGFKRFGCDDLIEMCLKKELESLGFSGGIKDVARWMGHPYQKQYIKTSKMYLNLEKKVMSEIIEYIKNSDEKIVIDTTGSVIYTGKEIMEKLKKFTTVAWLSASDAKIKKMYQLFKKSPKPIIWGNIFKRDKNESNKKALQESYPKLLKFRENKYREYADIYLDYNMLRLPNFSANHLINIISL